MKVKSDEIVRALARPSRAALAIASGVPRTSIRHPGSSGKEPSKD